MPTALLLGGPCDQETKSLPDGFNFGGPLRCQGTDYFVELGTRDPRIFVAKGHAWVVLKGAPCDGEQRGLTLDKFKSGQLMCSGHLYVNTLKDGQPLMSAQGAYVWTEVHVLENEAAPARSYNPHAAFTSMHTFLHSLGVYVPEQIKREQAALRRIRRAVR